MKLKTLQTMLTAAAGALALMQALVVLDGCTSESGASEEQQQVSARAVVSDRGTRIKFPRGISGLKQITSSVVRTGSALISVIAPSRVVASISPAAAVGLGNIVVFDSPDATSLYSQFKQGKANLDRASKNLTRIKDMYANQAATGKDLNDAETDVATTQASMAEYVGKLGALGFNAPELESAPAGTVWLISDVTETQLHEVQKGEEVDIYFASFPDRKMVGHADAIGDVIDPVSRTVKVRVSMPNPGGRLLPGMFARVDFGDSIDGVIVLPTSAIITVEGVDYAFLETAPGEYERRQVTLLNSGENQVVVSKGLQDGERVVTGGAMLLKGLSFGY
jgi:multidrug efflux pump subunit AcrA (membrane-fusion protein)